MSDIKNQYFISKDQQDKSSFLNDIRKAFLARVIWEDGERIDSVEKDKSLDWEFVTSS